MYIDESGDHVDPQSEGDNAGRYLALTGVCIEDGYYKDKFADLLDGLKRTHFPRHHPDSPVILVRRQIMDKKSHFGVLADPDKDAKWRADILRLILKEPYFLVTVVLDKWSHNKRYTQPLAPYHYCMEVLLERFHGFLEREDHHGDVMAEARNGDLDAQLKKVYSTAYLKGTRYVKPLQYQERLTTRELKIKKKSDNIPGLQLADLLAAPCKMDILNQGGRMKGKSTSLTRIIGANTRERHPNACRKFLV